MQSKSGHSFIKQVMREEDALYGGEMSAHHYFKDFAYCDSGMIPWLLVAELLGQTGSKLSSLVQGMQQAYPVSGEINNRVNDPDAIIAKVEDVFAGECPDKDYTDGLSMSCDTFRFNIRKSNTEPLLRLNVETRGDKKMLAEKTQQLLDLIVG